MGSSDSEAVIDVTPGFEGNVLGPVSVPEAAQRILAYCTEPRSGWATFDLTSLNARASGTFDQVTSWSLFYANALNGQVTLDNVAAFDRALRRDFANRLALVPVQTDLHSMHDAEIEAVVNACHFGFPGVWGPKITKLGALYRPRGIPVLDGHVAEAFGFDREGFTAAASQRSMTRRERIERVVRALALCIRDNRNGIAELRRRVTPTVPELDETPDLRLVDILIWTAQDDRMKRRTKQGARWIDRPVGSHVPRQDLLPEPIIK